MEITEFIEYIGRESIRRVTTLQIASLINFMI